MREIETETTRNVRDGVLCRSRKRSRHCEPAGQHESRCQREDDHPPARARVSAPSSRLIDADIARHLLRQALLEQLPSGLGVRRCLLREQAKARMQLGEPSDVLTGVECLDLVK
jgi:hypothetical protein